MLSSASHRQRGAALIIGLILIMVGSIGAIAIMRGNHIHDRMASNHHNQAIAQMAAEAGAARFVAWLSTQSRAPNTDDWKYLVENPDDDKIPERTGSSLPLLADDKLAIPLYGHYWIDANLNDGENPEWDLESDPNVVRVWVTGVAMQGDDILAETVAQVEAEWSGMGEWDKGMKQIGFALDGLPPDLALLAGTIDLNGGPQLVGNIHVNTSIKMVGGQTSVDGRLTSSGSCNVPSGIACTTNNIQNVTIPLPGPFIATVIESDDFIPTCSPGNATDCPGGDCGGKVFYCATDIPDLSNAVKNAIIIAAGDISMSGGLPLGTGQKPSVAIVAGGSINIGGSSQKAAIFWAGGDVRQSGSSSLEGQIVAGEGVNNSGTFRFTGRIGYERDGEDQTENTVRPTIISWSG
jgi:hypothetical protein